MLRTFGTVAWSLHSPVVVPEKGGKTYRMSRSISIFGLGYVGTVTAACLAHKACNVIGVDSSPGKVEAMASGRSPIVEPHVAELISEQRSAGRLHATSDPEYAVLNSEISFL